MTGDWTGDTFNQRQLMARFMKKHIFAALCGLMDSAETDGEDVLGGITIGI